MSLAQEACEHYNPNWAKWKASGHLCTGMGATPDCIHCGQNELAHYYADQARKRRQCQGFVPRHGFGNARTCLRCGEELAEHEVRVQ